jgi:glutaredoxin
VKIVVYGHSECVQCEWTLKWLDRLEHDYQYIDIRKDADAENDVKTMGFGDHPTLPVVVVSNRSRTEKWAGFKIDKIKGLRKTGDY